MNRKYELATELLKILTKNNIGVSAEEETSKCLHVPCNAIMVDFMGVMRCLTAVEITRVKTFGERCGMFLRMVLSYVNMSAEVHIILENYKNISIKSATRTSAKKV